MFVLCVLNVHLVSTYICISITLIFNSFLFKIASTLSLFSVVVTSAHGIDMLVGRIISHTSGYGTGPFAIFHALENLGAAQLKAGIAGEGDALTDGIVELDRGHATADGGAGIRTSLHTFWQTS